MEKILLEYPLECLPSKLNKRTGKALRCPYEAIDLNLYEEGARMITFHTTLPRIQPWHVAFISRTCLRILINVGKCLSVNNLYWLPWARIVPVVTKQQGTNKSAEAICATLKQQMINLKEERDSLKAQLQHERGNILH
jgi:hypothetical protein